MNEVFNTNKWIKFRAVVGHLTPNFDIFQSIYLISYFFWNKPLYIFSSSESPSDTYCSSSCLSQTFKKYQLNEVKKQEHHLMHQYLHINIYVIWYIYNWYYIYIIDIYIIHIHIYILDQCCPVEIWCEPQMWCLV